MALITAPRLDRPASSYREGRAGEAEEMYHDLAQELDIPEPAAEVLETMDPRAVALARAWAHDNAQPWPPRPESDVPKFQVYSL